MKENTVYRSTEQEIDPATGRPQLLFYWRFDKLGNTTLYGYVNAGISGCDTFIYDNSGKLLLKEGYFSAGHLRTTEKFVYDESGNNVAKSVLEYDTILKDEIRCRYDKRGNITESKVYVRGKFEQKALLVYDPNNLLLESRSYDKNNVLAARTNYEYDKKSHSVITKVYVVSDSLVQTSLKFYDCHDNLIKLTGYDDYGRVEKNVYTYNKHNDLVERRVYDLSDSLTTKQTFIYVYDKAGNWIKRTDLIQDTISSVVNRVIEYY